MKYSDTSYFINCSNRIEIVRFTKRKTHGFAFFSNEYPLLTSQPNLIFTLAAPPTWICFKIGKYYPLWVILKLIAILLCLLLFS